MVAGFNHNIRYKGELFHVQTEDSGRANPHIVTLVYRGGSIIGSAKTDYADIVKTDELELVVEAIMKEQHQGMMRRLKNGEFDARLFPPPVQPPPGDTPAPPAHGAAQKAADRKPDQRSLDEVILDYLITGEEK